MAAALMFFVLTIGLAVLSLRYLTARAPLDFHAEILQREGEEISAETAYVLLVMYRVIGSFMMGSAFVIAGMTAFWMGQYPERVAILVGLFGLIAGSYMSLTSYKMARDYNVESPWKPGMFLTVAAVLSAASVLFT